MRVVPKEPYLAIRSSEAIMNTVQTIDALNKAVALEKAATLQYKQHALLVRGVWRKVFADFFETVARAPGCP